MSYMTVNTNVILFFYAGSISSWCCWPNICQAGRRLFVILATSCIFMRVSSLYFFSVPFWGGDGSIDLLIIERAAGGCNVLSLTPFLLLSRGFFLSVFFFSLMSWYEQRGTFVSLRWPKTTISCCKWPVAIDRSRVSTPSVRRTPAVNVTANGYCRTSAAEREIEGKCRSRSNPQPLLKIVEVFSSRSSCC